MTTESPWHVFAAFPTAEMVSARTLVETFHDPFGIEAFWRTWYLDGFIRSGHGKVKFVRGRPGSGKTHLLRHLGKTAEELGYLSVLVDGAAVPLAGIDQLYRAVAQSIDWVALAGEAIRGVIARDLGYGEFTGATRLFLSWVADQGREPGLVRRDLTTAIDDHLTGADLSREFLLGARQLMFAEVGLAAEHTMAVRWFRGERLRAAERKPLGLKADVNSRNARGMLLSLAQWLRRLGRSGLVILVDNLDVLTETARVEGVPYYTRAKRDQAFEMIRELIDDSPFSAGLMTVLAGRDSALANPKTGFPSYPALWDRIQSEIQSKRPNRFADQVDLDALWAEDQRTDELRDRWVAKPVEWNPEPNRKLRSAALGLEWGLPRRVVAQALGERGRVEGGLFGD